MSAAIKRFVSVRALPLRLAAKQRKNSAHGGLLGSKQKMTKPRRGEKKETLRAKAT